MKIITSNTHNIMTPVMLNDINMTINFKYFWVLDLNMKTEIKSDKTKYASLIDFRLNLMERIEEITTPTLELSINNFRVTLPSSWNILVYSNDTFQLDIIQVSELAYDSHSAFLFDYATNKLIPNEVKVLKFNSIDKIISPSFHKHQMLCVGTSQHQYICTSVFDNYQRYLKQLSVGDLIY